MKILLKKFFTVILLIFLVGCSDGSKQAEIDQLREENGKLYTKLEQATQDLEEADAKIEELESKLNAISQNEALEVESNSLETEIIPPEQFKAEDALLGEWFYEEFRKNTEIDNWTQSLVFYANGTGIITRTLYLPKDIADYSTSDTTGEVSQSFSWSLDGDKLHTVFDNENHFVDYKYSSAQQQLAVINEGGKVRNGTSLYVREMPDIPEEYVEKNIIIGDIQAQEASLARKFLGNWYFDVLTWSFNDDGTGSIDIPKLGDQPATKREFSYSVAGNHTDMMITFEWSDGRTSYFYPTFNDDGSMVLQTAGNLEAIKLTRIFDIANCPMSQEIISNGIGVLSGSIFSDILPE